MEILHVSAECYPMAKAGGLGDVVGALPKYQTQAGHIAKVVMPMYRTKFLYTNEFVVDFKGSAYLGNNYFDFTIIKEKTGKLGFDLYLVDIAGLLDRENIYSYNDDSERFLSFQIAVLTWLNAWQHKPNVVHCHDHHTALIPFMMQHCYGFKYNLSSIKTVLTIHNAQYQGWMSWDKSYYLPTWDSWKHGLLDWQNTINPLASGIKCAAKVTTVSQSYMNELSSQSNGLEKLFEFEKGKCVGILNGIDNEVWNTANDSYLQYHYTTKTFEKGKEKNKVQLCKKFNLNPKVPLIIFIGRLVGEKAADLLPQAVKTSMHYYYGKFSLLILGSGDPNVESALNGFNEKFNEYFACEIGYNEQLSHTMYAGADFLLMPSRVEPCGLNQLYALRYGTIPIVRSTGGLQDTVKDMGEWEGFGIRFNNASIGDIVYSIGRAIDAFNNKTHFNWMIKHSMQINHSWQNTVAAYDAVYS
jgi:starch synthase